MNSSGVMYDRSWLEKARREQGYTQQEVATAAHVSVSHYCRTEKGLHNPDVKSALRICDFLRLNPRKFLSEKPITTPRSPVRTRVREAQRHDK